MLPNKTSPTWLWAYESLNRHSLMMCKVKKRQWKKLAISRGICGAHSLVKPKLISSTDDCLTHMIRMNGMNSHFETIGWWRFTRLFHVHVVTHVHIGVFTFLWMNQHVSHGLVVIASTPSFQRLHIDGLLL